MFFKTQSRAIMESCELIAEPEEQSNGLRMKRIVQRNTCIMGIGHLLPQLKNSPVSQAMFLFFGQNVRRAHPYRCS